MGVVPAGAEGQGEERGEQAVARRRADPFNPAESDRLDGSVVDDILVVSEDEGEEARRMAVEVGPVQPAAPNVPAAAMKSVLPEVRRKEEGKSRRGRAGAGASEGGDIGVRTGGRGHTGKGGKGQAGRPRRLLFERVLGLWPLSPLSAPFSPFPFLVPCRMPSP